MWGLCSIGKNGFVLQDVVFDLPSTVECLCGGVMWIVFWSGTGLVIVILHHNIYTYLYFFMLKTFDLMWNLTLHVWSHIFLSISWCPSLHYCVLSAHQEVASAKMNTPFQPLILFSLCWNNLLENTYLIKCFVFCYNCMLVISVLLYATPIHSHASHGTVLQINVYCHVVFINPIYNINFVTFIMIWKKGK